MEPVQTTSPLNVPAEFLATLVEISEEINSSLDLDEVLKKTATLVKRLVDYEIFGVMLLDESTQRLYHRFTIGYGEQASKDWQIPLGQGITGTAAATGRAVRVGDVREDPRYINIIDSVRSELVVPLVVKGQAIGVLDIQSTQVDYFTRDQQSVLTLMASRLAVAIENARLFERVRSQADTLLVLNEVGREANSILDVEELLRRAAELVKRVINYQILGILLYDEATNVFRHRLDVKYGQSAQGKLRVTANEGVVGAAISSGHPVRVPDVTQDSRYFMVNPETRSELAIPMIHKGRVVGVLDLESPQTNYFTEDHVQTLMILGAHLAVSLENARLYEQLARDEARMDRELTAAQRLQNALLRPVPTVDFGLDIAARILSARQVCGDLYDFLSYGTQQLGVALGDVSGKGSAAALYGAVATGILRSLSPHKLQPAELLRQLNQLVSDRRVEGRYMTFCFATWQKGRRILRVANAGQTQPLLWKDGHVEQLKLSGFPIGIFDDATYDEWSVKLSKGDILVFYSDGLTEASNREGKFFGSSRLIAVLEKHTQLSSSDLADRMLEEVQEFTEGGAITDDRTLVVMKVK
ncbi:MAG: serine phosphatase [Candidatus Acidoferrum typicum]|jgi:sigma-B regulation protein RsbU (phosphoserine phosphatase)|nr:serine phosphatase [Candidatus Acidoferrum typicum]